MIRSAVAIVVFFTALPVVALGPADVFLVVNKNEPASRELAEHYCKKRGVPRGHIVALDLPIVEDITRRDYEAKLAGPLRERLQDKKDRVKVLLTFYGVPLRVGGTHPTADEKSDLAKVRVELAAQRKQKTELDATITKLEAAAKKEPGGPAVKEHLKRRDERTALERRIRQAEGRERWLSHAESQAAVDSELALLWHPPYELRRWQINPLYFQVAEAVRAEVPAVLLTCRLDGPGPAVVKRMINDAVRTEAKGLAGTAYFDARDASYDPKRDTGHGYGGYDESLREAAQQLKAAGLPVVLDNTGDLFKPNSCPDCALYCGWYSHAKFIDSCRFVPGAVAYHIASSEATTLRDPKTNVWCPRLLMAGACATLGPVAEPYTIGFPKPAEFFGFLATGELTLVECYWKSALFTSWMTTLVGDPLYQPFAKSPRLKLDQVRPSPKGGRFEIGRAKE